MRFKRSVAALLGALMVFEAATAYAQPLAQVSDAEILFEEGGDVLSPMPVSDEGIDTAAAEEGVDTAALGVASDGEAFLRLVSNLDGQEARITIHNDITLNEGFFVYNGSDLTVDLNGHSIKGGRKASVKPGARLSLTDTSGKMGSAHMIFDNRGELDLEGVAVYSEAAVCVLNRDRSSFYATDASIDTTGKEGLTVLENREGSLAILTRCSSVSPVVNAGSMIVNGGTFGEAAFSNSGTINLGGDVFINRVDSTGEVTLDDNNANADVLRIHSGGSITVNGGVARLIDISGGGSLLMRGGNAGQIRYDDNIPRLMRGKVGTGSTEAGSEAVINMAAGGDVTQYFFLDEEGLKKDAFTASYTTDEEGRVMAGYQGAALIVDGVINPADYRGIDSATALANAARNGGVYYLTGNVTVPASFKQTGSPEGSITLSSNKVLEIRAVDEDYGIRFMDGGFIVEKEAETAPVANAAIVVMDPAGEAQGKDTTCLKLFADMNGSIENHGEVELRSEGTSEISMVNHAGAKAGIYDGTVIGHINNYGSLDMESGKLVSDAGYAVFNIGQSASFEMTGGIAQGDSAVIVHDLEHNGPSLEGGRVSAVRDSETLYPIARNGSCDFVKELTRGAAVVRALAPKSSVSENTVSENTISANRVSDNFIVRKDLDSVRVRTTVSDASVIDLSGRELTEGLISGSGDGKKITAYLARELVDGEPVGRAEIRLKCSYLLLEPGDTAYRAIDPDDIFELRADFLVPGYSLASSDPAVAEAGDNGIRAHKNGRACITASSTFGPVAKMYIDVVKDRTKISASDYEAALVTTSDTVNAYAEEKRIYFTWKLSDTAVGSTVSPDMLYRPRRAYVSALKSGSSESISYYFNDRMRTPEPGSGSYDVKYDSSLNRYYISLYNIPEMSGDTAVTTKLAASGIQSFKDLSVTLVVMPAEGGSLPGCQVPLNEKLQLTVKRTKPSVTPEDPIVLNTAYEPDAAYTLKSGRTDEEVYITPGAITRSDIDKAIKTAGSKYKLTDLTFPSVTGSFITRGAYNDEEDPLLVYYSGTLKKKSKDSKKDKDSDDKEDEASTGKTLVGYAEYEGYIGRFKLRLPLSLKAAYPMPVLDKKTIKICGSYGDSSDITVNFKSSSDGAALGTIKDVEIADSNDFSIYYKSLSGSNHVVTGDGYRLEGDRALVIRANSDITSPVTLKLKVSFSGVRQKGNKDYVRTLKLKLKPVNPGNFTMKVEKKPVIHFVAGETTGTDVKIATEPQDFHGGRMTVSVGDEDSENEPEIEVERAKDEAGNVIENTFRVTTNQNASASTRKQFFYVNWYADDGVTPLTKKPLKVTVKFDNRAPYVTMKKNPVININRGRSVKKWAPTLVDDLTAEKMAATVPVIAINASFDSIADQSAPLFDAYEEDGKLKIAPSLEALKAGKIVPGEHYSMNLIYKVDGLEKTISTPIRVDIKEIKEYKASAVVRTDSPCELSLKSPGDKADFTVKTKKPFYGMRIQSVEIDEKDKNGEYFEITSGGNTQSCFTASDESGGADGAQYRIGFAGEQIPDGLKKGSRTVKLVISYDNGCSAKAKLKVKLLK